MIHLTKKITIHNNVFERNFNDFLVFLNCLTERNCWHLVRSGACKIDTVRFRWPDSIIVLRPVRNYWKKVKAPLMHYQFVNHVSPFDHNSPSYNPTPFLFFFCQYHIFFLPSLDLILIPTKGSFISILSSNPPTVTWLQENFEFNSEKLL